MYVFVGFWLLASDRKLSRLLCVGAESTGTLFGNLMFVFLNRMLRRLIGTVSKGKRPVPPIDRRRGFVSLRESKNHLLQFYLAMHFKEKGSFNDYPDAMGLLIKLSSVDFLFLIICF